MTTYANAPAHTKMLNLFYHILGYTQVRSVMRLSDPSTSETLLKFMFGLKEATKRLIGRQLGRPEWNNGHDRPKDDGEEDPLSWHSSSFRSGSVSSLTTLSEQQPLDQVGSLVLKKNSDHF